MIRKLGASVIVAAALLAPGAAEAGGATFVVTKTGDTADGVCDADCSLREAVIEANAAPGADAITLPAGMYQRTLGGLEEEANLGDLDVLGDLEIAGGGADVTVIDGEGLDRVFQVHLGGNLQISDVTVTNGNGAGGGGVQNSGHLTLVDVKVSGNSAGEGGGIYNGYAAVVTLANVTLSENTATANPGEGLANKGNASLTNVTMSGNSASHYLFGRGGAIYNGLYGNGEGLIQIMSSTIADSLAGGGIYNEGAVQIKNTILAYNNGNCSTPPWAPGAIVSLGHNLDDDVG